MRTVDPGPAPSGTGAAAPVRGKPRAQEGRSPSTEVRQLRLEEVKFVIDAFRLERYVHLFFASLALAAILGCAGRLLWNGQPQITDMVGIFGSSGILTVAMSRVLTLFNRVLLHLAGGK